MIYDNFLPRIGPLRSVRRPYAFVLAAWLAVPAIGTAQSTPPATQATQVANTGTVVGVALDSLHGGALENAVIQLLDSQVVKREVLSKERGVFHFDSVPEGRYSLRMLHHSLDTLGVLITSPAFTVTAGETRQVDIGIPPAHRLISILCPAEVLVRGPAAVMGIVRDPDTNEPVVGASVQLDNTTKDVFGLTRIPSVRSVTTDAQGRFRICGLPPQVNGKVVATLNGVTSGEVPVAIDDNELALGGISFSLTNRVVTVTNDSGRVVRVLQGEARLTGTVVNDRGEPVSGARVALVGTMAVAITNAQGNFTLDSLPAGSQIVEIRKIGYGFTERGVDILTSGNPTPVTLTMERFVATLPPVHTVANLHDLALKRVGFTDRREKATGGYLRSGDELNRMTILVSDMLRQVPGLRIRRVEDGDSQDNMIEPLTGGIKVCINFIVDGNPFKMVEHGDLDRYIQPDLVEALEYYRPSQVPIEFFGRGGPTECSVLVLWTRGKIPPPPGR